MNWWNVLEVSHDSDLKTIKKAYAKLLKIHNPEDDAEEYQKLREAYDEAVKYAKRNNKKTQEFVNDNLDKHIVDGVNINEKRENASEIYSNQNKSSVDSYIDYINNNKNEEKVDESKINKSKVDSYIEYINYEGNRKENKKDEEIKFKSNIQIDEIYYKEQNAKISLNEPIKKFLNRLNEIYNDISLRIDTEAWDDLLNSDAIWNVQASSIIEDEMFEFLTKHKYLPAEIWIKLNNNFTWSKNEIKLYNKYSAPIVDEFLKNLKEPNKLKYDYIRPINPEIADEYLYERQQAEEALKNRKYAKAYNHLKNANSLYSADAELLRLMGDYNYEFKNLEKALKFYQSAFEINNNDLNSALRIGRILFSGKYFNEAISYLRLYLSYNNNDKLALNDIAYSYYYNDDLIMAKENFQKLLCFDENNKTIKKYLKNIEARLEGKHVRKLIFDRDNIIVDEVVKKEINTEKKSNMNGKSNGDMTYNIKYVIRVIVIFIMFFGLRHSSGYKNSVNYNNTQNNKTYENENKNKENINNFEKTILDPKKNSNITMNLNNVKATKYYKISEPFENKSIFLEQELEGKGLCDKVESQLYVGSTKNNVVIFADSKCNDKTINKNGGYMIGGTMCPIDEEIGDKIKKEYASDYQGFDWISNGFIDASKAAKK